MINIAGWDGAEASVLPHETAFLRLETCPKSVQLGALSQRALQKRVALTQWARQADIAIASFGSGIEAGTLGFKPNGLGAFPNAGFEAWLQNHRIKTLILAGDPTPLAILSTLYAAFEHRLSCITVADACAASDLDAHDRAIDVILGESQTLGTVCDSTALLGTTKNHGAVGITLGPMTDADGDAVLALYAEGIATGHATFQSGTGDWENFKTGKMDAPRLVAKDTEGQIVGFATVSATSGRPVYRGVLEVSVYVSAQMSGRGVGRALLDEIISACRKKGAWCLTAGIFPENEASLALHTSLGFRCMGRQYRAGIMPYGPFEGRWRDVLRLTLSL